MKRTETKRYFRLADWSISMVMTVSSLRDDGRVCGESLHRMPLLLCCKPLVPNCPSSLAFSPLLLLYHYHDNLNWFSSIRRSWESLFAFVIFKYCTSRINIHNDVFWISDKLLHSCGARMKKVHRHLELWFLWIVKRIVLAFASGVLYGSMIIVIWIILIDLPKNLELRAVFREEAGKKVKTYKPLIQNEKT